MMIDASVSLASGLPAGLCGVRQANSKNWRVVENALPAQKVSQVKLCQKYMRNISCRAFRFAGYFLECGTMNTFSDFAYSRIRRALGYRTTVEGKEVLSKICTLGHQIVVIM
jgi:hypothetical protein